MFFRHVIEYTCFYFLFIVIGCNSQKDNLDLGIGCFTSGEVSQLNQLLEYYENLICSDRTENFGCFMDYFNLIDSVGNVSPYHGSFEVRDYYFQCQKDYEFLWLESCGVRKPDYFSESYALEYIHFSEKYLCYLKNLLQDDQYTWLKDYLSTYMGGGNITPSMFAFMIENSSELDFSDPNVRLIILVHHMQAKFNYY